MRPFVTLALLLPLSCIASPDSVQVFWSGALTPHSISIRARVSTVTDSVRVAYCEAPCTAGYNYSAYVTADAASDQVARIDLNGLQPETPYTYRFEVNAVLDTAQGRVGHFTTPPIGSASFSFVTGSCNGDSKSPVWQAMRDRDPLFFLGTGDLHYRDPNSLDPEAHRAPYREAVLASSPMNELLHQAPIAYVWDDHDFCGNNSDGESVGKVSAARAYREYVPHYPLSNSTGVYQAFTIGRVHFIMSDLRSSKSYWGMMDVVQYTWLLQQFLHARDNGLVACWVSPLTWNSMGWPENWACQPEERRAISDFLYAQHVKDLFIISGDAHMLAIDDGANADFSTAQSLAYHYPIFQAAAISRFGSYKGGNFNQGGVFPNPYPWNGQFGEVIVNDDGQDVCITLNGYRTDSMSSVVSVVNTYSFCRTPSTPDAVTEASSSALEAWYAQGAGLLVRGPASVPIAIRVSDAQGRLIKEARATVSPESTLIALNELPPGLYTATLVQGERRIALRFVRTD